MRAGLADGTIDCIGTDHAPHPLEMKDCEWQAGAFGMTGLETALSVVIETMVKTGKLDWRGVARVMSQTPARIGRLEDQGGDIAVGQQANLAIIDPNVNPRGGRRQPAHCLGQHSLRRYGTARPGNCHLPARCSHCAGWSSGTG